MKLEDNTKDSSAFLQGSNQLLDESVESLDAATLSQLNQARQKALACHHTKAFSPLQKTAVFASLAFASLAIAAIASLLWLNIPQQAATQQLATSYEDIEILTSYADLELLQDLEFVSWLLVEELDAEILNMELNDAS